MTENIQLETKNRILKSKKFIISAIIVLLLLVAGGASYWYFFLRLSSNIISYIPQNFDQVYYMKIDNDFKELLDKVKTESTNNKMFEVIKSVDELVGYEYLSGDQHISFVVAKVNKDFDMQKAVDAGLQTGSDYDFKKINANTYLYGLKDSIEFALNYKGDKIADDKQLNSKVRDLVGGKYNFAMFTKANTARFSEENELSSFLQKLGYGSFVAHIGYQRSYGQLGILFKQDIGYGKDYKFNQKFGNYVNSDSIMFAEMGNIPQFLGVNKEQLAAGASMLLADVPNASIVMTQDDYQKIGNSLDGNIALSLTKANNIAGVGLGILFEKSDMFETINKLFPYFKTYMDTQLKQSFSTGVDVKYIQENNQIGADITASFGGLPLKIGVILEKKGENMALGILSPNLQTSDNIKLKSGNKTLVNFYLELNNMIELYNKLQMLSPTASSLPNLDFFKDKKVYGSLELDGDMLLLNYDTQN